ncbi:embryo defective protein [Tanacetum coccineum]
MKQLSYIFCTKVHSSAATLLLLGAIEQATRHSVGCEGFLNWCHREDDTIPIDTSEGYNQLLKLLMQKPRHDVASLATYILHRARFYELATRYEKLITSSALVEDPSPVASTSIGSILVENSGLFSDKASSMGLLLCQIVISQIGILIHVCFFFLRYADCQCLIGVNSSLRLSLERGFLPLFAALLSSSKLHSEVGHAGDLFMDTTSYISSIILSLVFCRSAALPSASIVVAFVFVLP